MHIREGNTSCHPYPAGANLTKLFVSRPFAHALSQLARGSRWGGGFYAPGPSTTCITSSIFAGADQELMENNLPCADDDTDWARFENTLGPSHN